MFFRTGRKDQEMRYYPLDEQGTGTNLTALGECQSDESSNLTMHDL